MSEHTEQIAAAEAVPARIGLDDFIEAVTRGVARAMAAEDEVSGYAAKRGGGPPATIGIVFLPFSSMSAYGEMYGGGSGASGGGDIFGRTAQQ